MTVPSSATPIRSVPPLLLRNATKVLRTAFSMRGSFSPVFRFVLIVDLNSMTDVSPVSMIFSMLRISWSSMPNVSAFSDRNFSRVCLNSPLWRLR